MMDEHAHAALEERFEARRRAKYAEEADLRQDAIEAADAFHRAVSCMKSVPDNVAHQIAAIRRVIERDFYMHGLRLVVDKGQDDDG